MVAPSIAATGTLILGTSAEAETHPFAKPSGVVVGSMLVALYTVEHNGSGVQLAPPTGWAAPPGTPAFQAVANGTALYVWWRFADANDADPGTTTYLMPVQVNRWVRGGIMRLTDHASTNPWEAGDGEVAASSTDVPSTSVTTTGPDRLLLWGASSYNLSLWDTMPTGFTEIAAFAGVSSNTTVAAQRTLAVVDTVTTGPVPTGATAGKAGWLGAIKPMDGMTIVPGTASVSLGALDVSAVAGPQLKTGTAAVGPGGVSITATGLRIVSGTASVALPAPTVTARPRVRGTASVSLGALSVAATGETVFPPPGQTYDLSQWHLTLPTEDPGDGNAAQIDQPELETYTDDNFYVDGDGMMVFRAPVDGATTSAAAGGTRAELRQRLRGSYAEAAIDPHTTGRYQLTVTTHADATNITGGSNPRKEAVIGQIHGAGDSPIPLILSAEYHVATPRVRVFKNGPSDPVKPNAVLGITPTTPITYRIRIENARLKLWVVIGQVADLPSIDTTAHYDWPVTDFTDDEDWYGKAGIYNKTTVESGSTGESIARISFIEMLEPGDPDPTDVVSGTASVGLGALNVAAVGTVVQEPHGDLPVFSTSFEPGDFTQFQSCQWTGRNDDCQDYDGTSDYSAQVVALDGRPHVARFEVRDGDVPPFGGGERSEVAEVPDTDIFVGDEVWFALDVKFPADFPTPVSIWHIIAQLHSNSDVASPTLTLTVHPDESLYLTNDEPTSELLSTEIGPIVRGQWVRYVVHFKAGLTSADGWAEVYQDGALTVAQHPRATVYNLDAHYWKWGIYRNPIHTATSIVYLDNLRITQALTGTTDGTALVTLPAPVVTATGTRTVRGTAAVGLPAPSVTGTGARVVPGTAEIELGALTVAATGDQTVTGTASISLGQLSVTAVGSVVAEVVTGSASVALGGLAITAVGSRVTTGTAVVTLPALVVSVLGTAQEPSISAGTPIPVPGPYAGTPTPAARPYAGTPTPVTGPTAGTPIAR